MNWIIAKGLLIPFLGTALGSALVFFMKKELDTRIQKILSGFAAGVMIAASVWSLLIPSMEMSADKGRLAFIPAGPAVRHKSQKQVLFPLRSELQSKTFRKAQLFPCRFIQKDFQKARPAGTVFFQAS